jgi:DNA-binding beta-propeller fold protein YncE
MLMLGRRLALLVGILLCVVSCGLVLGGASASAFAEHLFNGSFGGEGAGNGQFVEPSGVAVNTSTHDVYVVDRGNGRVEVFSSAGAYVGQFNGSAAPTGAFSAPSAIAVDNSENALDPSAGDVYVVDTGHNAIDKFTSTGTYLGQLTETTGGATFGELDGVAVDAAGAVWVYQGSGEIDSFSDALGNEYVSQRSSPFGVSQGFAVDGADDLYVNRGAQVFGKLNSSGEILTEEVDGPTSTAAAVDLSNGEVFIDNVHTIGAFSPTGSLLERFGAEQGVEHLQGGSGVAVDPGSGTVYVADATTDLLDIFTAVVVPSIESPSAKNVTRSSADLTASVNPNAYDTTYRFEWGTSTAYGTRAPVPDADVGAGASSVLVTVHLSGLSADTTYHWRVVAQNAKGTTATGDHTFIYSSTAATLPDGRAYEMVSPLHKNVALVGARGAVFNYPDISEDGSRMAAFALGCFADAGSCTVLRGGLSGEPYIFTHTGSGWVTSAMAPPATQFGGNDSYMMSADTGTALFSIGTPPVGEDDWYSRGSGGAFADIGPVTPSFAGLSSISHYAATADLSHVVWMVDAAGRWPFDPYHGGPGYAVYEYVDSGNAAPSLVGVNGGAGSTDLISGCGIFLPSEQGSLSADGRTVFFEAEVCPSGSGANAGVPVPADELYARIEGSRSVLISGRSPADCTSAVCLASPPSDAVFEGASADGSKVFFTSTQQLMDSASEDNTSGDSASLVRGSGCHATVGVNGCNLYEYDFAAPAGHNLVAVSAGDSSDGGPRVQGVAALSSDGSHVYFVARGVLTGAGNSAGRTAVDRGENLYVYERDARFPSGHVAFVATLSDAHFNAPGSDSEQWIRRDARVMNVTPDGQFLVFTSSNALTPDDTSTTGVPQVFRYDAQTGELVRISIGDRGFDDNGNGGIPCTGGVCSRTLTASIVPPFAGRQRAGAARLDPTMSHDGAYVFFQSPAALTPGALDDAQIGTFAGDPAYAQNVYEYHEGRVHLISDGKDLQNHELVSDTRLLGSDGTGANVFFMTADPLVAQDTDTQQDIYDARVCTASEPCTTSPPSPTVCQGEECHGVAGAAPVAPGAGSIAFSGVGNLTAPSAGKAPAKKKAAVRCTKGKRLTHGRCVKAHRKKKGKKASAKRATANHGGKK